MGGQYRRGAEMTNYPTDSVYAAIVSWPYTDIHGLFDYIEPLVSDYGTVRRIPRNDGSTLFRLTTGGWSGNEEIVSAIQDNLVIHSFTWEMSVRGGMHVWRIPKKKEEMK